MKYCQKCGDFKPLDEFYRRPANTDGYDGRCKVCERARSRKRKLSSEQEEAKRVYNRVRYAKNPERGKASAKAWSAENRGKTKGYKKKWKRDNPDKVAAHKEHRGLNLLRSRLAGDEAALAAFYRGRPEGMEVDHIVPVRGKNVSGLDVSWNLQYLTPEENNRKGNRHDHVAE